ncbi:hypothetical protein R6Q59_018553 [Mikania micrantha]|uniref:mitogen-activated protein kinase kinase kinase n=1 Tax=Mikania micrantha TaxID=192012 RepID=A0A5N6M0K2_9ASTR|nr:hypothetical protein E3N88_35258 [Mikania micrantha]
MKLYSRQKPRVAPRRLERRNAIRNIDYDASTSPSPSFIDQSAHGIRSLDFASVADNTSFRIGGSDGQFDVICRRLGLSGPDDFAISTDDWERRRSYSPPRGSFPSTYRVHHADSSLTKELPVTNLSVSFESKISVSDDEFKTNGECSSSAENGDARVSETNGDIESADEVNVSRISQNSLGVDLATTSGSARISNDGGVDERRNVESGINGLRPPLVTPPPAMSLVMVDDMGSSWDLIRAFAPRDNEDLSSDGLDDRNGMMNAVVSPTGSDADDEGSSTLTVEVQYPLTTNGSFRGSFKNWQKGEYLGSGSFGTVYEGFTEMGDFFAVKEVSLLEQGGQENIQQLQQEISLLSQFHHVNIVQYLGTDTVDGKLYIFLELVTKGSLAKLYQKYELRDSQVSAYTRQILSGLNYLHERKVVHRDIKCANILVDASGSVKLADFGLAKATALNDIKSCKGTPYWMAPEVVKSRSSNGYGLAADIWSLGCTVLEMLTRKVPYSHLEGFQALFRIGRGEPPPIPETLSKEAQDFILKCLQVNPHARPTAAQLLDHSFVRRRTSMNFALASPPYNASQL